LPQSKISSISLLDGQLLRGRGFARTFPARPLARDHGLFPTLQRGLLLSGEIQIHGANGVRHAAATLPQREEDDAKRGAEQPEDADDDPAAEEGFAEDVAGAVHRHGPEDQQAQSHDDCQRAGVEGGLVELARLFLRHVLRVRGLARDEFQVDVGSGGDVRVVDLADVAHRLVVVVLPAEDQGQDWDEDHGAQESGHVAREHGVADLLVRTVRLRRNGK
jgi:hypothetical protein